MLWSSDSLPAAKGKGRTSPRARRKARAVLDRPSLQGWRTTDEDEAAAPGPRDSHAKRGMPVGTLPASGDPLELMARAAWGHNVLAAGQRAALVRSFAGGYSPAPRGQTHQRASYGLVEHSVNSSAYY
jgi:hypothetical protein